MRRVEGSSSFELNAYAMGFAGDMFLQPSWLSYDATYCVGGAANCCGWVPTKSTIFSTTSRGRRSAMLDESFNFSGTIVPDRNNACLRLRDDGRSAMR